MFPQRRLLYHRGLDDSVGTYVTDYVLAAECLVLVVVLYYFRFIKYSKSLSKTSDSTRSTWTILALLIGVGIAAFIGGLAHQFLGTVEPYSVPQDAFHWVVLWRLAAAFSGCVTFALFSLAEYLITSEELLSPHRYVYYAYYVFAALFSLGVVIHSFVLVAEPEDPWTLLITFSLVFVVAIFEWICSLIVLTKRFNSTSTPVSNTCGMVEKSSVIAYNNYDKQPSNHRTLQQQASLEPLNNNGAPSSGRRWDLLMFFMGTLTLLIGGAIQTILGRFFNCSNHHDAASQGCPLPNSFNHNSVFHIFQIVSAACYFTAEILSYRHRMSLSEKPQLPT